MGISRPVMEIFPSAALYFISFILLTAFIVLNVVIGVVVNTISELSEEQRNEEFQALLKNESEVLIYKELQALKMQTLHVEKLFQLQIKMNAEDSKLVGSIEKAPESNIS